MSWAVLTFEWYEDAMVFRIFIFIFLFRTNGKKGHLNESEFHHCSGNFSKVLFWKLLDHSYVDSQELWATLTKAFWKTPNSLRFYGHGSTHLLILLWTIYAEIVTRRKCRAPLLLLKNLHDLPDIFYARHLVFHHCTSLKERDLFFKRNCFYIVS